MPVVIAVNKVDRTSNPRTVAALQAADDLGLDAEVFPVSARTGYGMQALVAHLSGLLPEGPFYFPPEEISDQPESVLLAELVREQVLSRTRQEVPHSVEVHVEEIEDRGDLITVRALLWVETESQKGIVIGSGGRMIKAIGSAARKELERELGARVHLDLSVRVRRSWRADDALLDRLGITLESAERRPPANVNTGIEERGFAWGVQRVPMRYRLRASRCHAVRRLFARDSSGPGEHAPWKRFHVRPTRAPLPPRPASSMPVLTFAGAAPSERRRHRPRPRRSASNTRPATAASRCRTRAAVAAPTRISHVGEPGAPLQHASGARRAPAAARRARAR